MSVNTPEEFTLAFSITVGYIAPVELKVKGDAMKQYVNLRSPFLVYGTLAFIGSLLLSCIEKPGEFVAPISDTRIEDVTLLTSTHYFSEAVEKSNDLVVNESDRTVAYLYTQNFERQGLDSVLKVTPSGSSQKTDLGVFSIGAFPEQSLTVTATELGLPTGTVQALPSSTNNTPLKDVDNTSTLEYVSVNSGTMTLRITNTLPVAVTFTTPITLRNNQDGDASIITTWNVGTIYSNSSIELTNTLAGKFIRGKIRLESATFTTEEKTTPVTINASDGLVVRLTTSSIVADSAIAVIPEQEITSIKDSVLVIDDSVTIYDASFKKGRLRATIVNQLDVFAKVNFEVSDLKQNGTSYKVDTLLSAKQTTIKLVDFRTIRVQPLHVRTFGTEVQFSLGIKTINSGGQKRKVTKYDFVEVSLQPDPSEPEFYITTVRGKVPPQTMTLNYSVPSNIDFRDLKNFTADKINFSGIQLALKLPISSGFPMDYNLMFYAKNTKRGWVDSIPIVTGAPGFPRIDPNVGVPIITVSSVPNFDDFISKFFPEAPDSFIVKGIVIVSPRDVYESNVAYTIYDTTSVYPSMDMKFPLAAGIKNGCFKQTVALREQNDGDEKVPSDFTERTKGAILTFNFTNKLPFAMTFKTYLLGKRDPSGFAYGVLDSIITTDTIRAARVGSDGYTLDPPEKSKVKVILSKSQVENFNRSDSMQVNIYFSTTGNNATPVKVRTTDYIKVYIVGTLTFSIVKP